MIKFTAPSGAEVEIEEATFEDAWNLKQSLCEILLVLDLPFEEAMRSLVSVLSLKKEEQANFELGDLKFSDLLSAEVIPDIVAKVMLAVMQSKKIRDHAFKCLERSRYNGEVIKTSIFEKADRRKDYLPILKECVKVNVLPFMPPLVLGS